MHKFKDGDKLLCVDIYSDYDAKPTIGQIYTYCNRYERYVHTDWIYLKEAETYSCYERKYFIRLSELPNKRMIRYFEVLLEQVE